MTMETYVRNYLNDDDVPLVASTLYFSTGIPDNAFGNNGDFVLRSDAGSDGSAVFYAKRSGVWVPIL